MNHARTARRVVSKHTSMHRTIERSRVACTRYMQSAKAFVLATMDRAVGVCVEFSAQCRVVRPRPTRPPHWQCCCRHIGREVDHGSATYFMRGVKPYGVPSVSVWLLGGLTCYHGSATRGRSHPTRRGKIHACACGPSRARGANPPPRRRPPRRPRRSPACPRAGSPRSTSRSLVR